MDFWQIIIFILAIVGALYILGKLLDFYNKKKIEKEKKHAELRKLTLALRDSLKLVEEDEYKIKIFLMNYKGFIERDALKISKNLSESVTKYLIPPFTPYWYLELNPKDKIEYWLKELKENQLATEDDKKSLSTYFF